MDGPLIYRILATEHFETISGRIRNDLRDGFDRLRQEAIERMRRQLGEVGVQALADAATSIEAFVQRRFTLAALAGLARNGIRGDAEIVRPYLDSSHHDVAIEAVGVLSRFGNEADVMALVAIAKAGRGELRKAAADAALKLDPGGVASEAFLASNDPVLVAKGLSLMPYEQAVTSNRPVALLNNENLGVRTAALLYLVEKASGPELEQTLREYVTQKTYYYNVVCWLDRLLYTPSPLKEMYTRDLRRQSSE